MHHKIAYCFIFFMLVMFPAQVFNMQNQAYAQTSSSSSPNSNTTTQPFITFTALKVDSNPVPNKPFKVSVSITSVNPSNNPILSLTVPTGISIISEPFPKLTFTSNQNERMATWTLLAAKAGVYSITVNSYSSVPYETDTYSFTVPVGALNSLVVTGIDIPGNIYPNDNFTVGIKLKNAANIPDTLVRAQITVPAGLHLLDSVSSPSISLDPSQETEFRWKIQAQASGSSTLTFDYSSLNSGDNSIQANVNVGSIGVSDVVASKIYLGGSDSRSNLVGPGDKNVPLVVVLTNTGTNTLYNMEGILPLGNPFSSDTSQSVEGQLPSESFHIGQLSPGNSANMTYYVNIKNPTAPKTYVNKLQVSYYDGKEQHVKLLDIPVAISNGVLLSITAQKTSIFANAVTPVTLEIRNDGAIAVHNFKITSTTGNLFTSVDTPVWVGDVPSGETKETVLKVISANNTNSQYPIPILVSYDANGQVYSSSFQVSAQASTTPDFYVQSVNITPNQSYSGDIAKSIAVQLLNSGLSDANNVTASLILPKGFTPSWGNATDSFLGRVKAQDVSTATFYINIGDNVTSGNYPFTLIVKDEKQTKQLDLDFIVSQKAVFKIISIDASQLYPGSSNALFTATLQNIGTDAAQTVTTTLLAGNTVPGVKSTDITTVGNQENIGNVLPNQVFTTTFIVNVDPLATPGDKQESIEIKWTNTGNINFVQTLPLPYHLANGPAYLLYIGPVPLTYVIIAIGLVIVLFIFLKRRRSRIQSITSAWPAEMHLGKIADSPQIDMMENQAIPEQVEINKVNEPTQKNNNVAEVEKNIPKEINKNKINEPTQKNNNVAEVEKNIPKEINKNKESYLETSKDEFQIKKDYAIIEMVTNALDNLNANNAIALDADQNEVFNVPIKKVIKNLRSSPSEVKYLILNGEITKSIVDEAILEGIPYVVGRHKDNIKEPKGLNIKTFEDLGIVD